MGYSRNFGFRSFENIVRDGRFRTAAGSAHVIGAPVVLDANTPGFLEAAGAGVAPGPAAGVVVYEHLLPTEIKQTYSDVNTVPGGAYAQIVHGQGTKVWFKNTAQKTMYDGDVHAAAGLLAASVVVANLAPGDQLTPDGSGKFKVGNGTTDGAWLVVEQANSSTGVVEARFTF
jgi:hypothetical protein